MRIQHTITTYLWYASTQSTGWDFLRADGHHCVDYKLESTMRQAYSWQHCGSQHAFAMDHEDAQFITRDKFHKAGQKIMIKERWELAEWNMRREEEELQSEQDQEEQGEIKLLEGKLKQERLKKDLFVYLNSE